MLRFLNNILILVFFTGAVHAQVKDSTKRSPSFIPTGIRVGTDLISIIRTQTEDDFSGYEFNADVDFYRYYLTAEIGKWERNFLSDEENYTNEGSYFRIGVDINFLKKDPEKNMFYFGMRYGQGLYSEKLALTVEDPVWGSVTTTYTNTDVKASWWEITTGIKVKMYKFFWMGYTARLKFALNTDATGEFESHDVPGYGKASTESTWGFNYQLMFRIPVRKQK